MNDIAMVALICSHWPGNSTEFVTPRQYASCAFCVATSFGGIRPLACSPWISFSYAAYSRRTLAWHSR